MKHLMSICLFVLIATLLNVTECHEFVQNIHSGWNAISVPFNGLSKETFDTLIVIHPEPDPPECSWLCYDGARFGGAFRVSSSSTLELGKGYFYYFVAPSSHGSGSSGLTAALSRYEEITYSGVPSRCIDYDTLYPGPNFIGPGLSVIDTAQFRAAFPSLEGFYRVNSRDRFSIDTTMMRNLPYMSPGKAYWAYMDTDTPVVADTCINGVDFGELLWEFDVPHSSFKFHNVSSPSIDDDGFVYFTEHTDTDTFPDDPSESLYVFTMQPTVPSPVCWKSFRDNAHFKHNPTPVIDPESDRLYLANGDFVKSHSLGSLDTTGVAEINCQGHFVGDPAIGCEFIVAGQFDTGSEGDSTESFLRLYERDTHSLSVSYTTDSMFRIVTGPVIGHNGNIYVGIDSISGSMGEIHYHGYIQSYLFDGTPLSRFDFPDSCGTFSKYSSFALDTTETGYTRIFAGCMDGNLYAFIDSSDGSGNLYKLWSIDLGERLNSSPAIGYDNMLYVGSYSDTAVPATGALWAINIDSIPISDTLLNGDSLANWKITTSGGVWGTPTIGNDSVIYFGTSDSDTGNMVYAIRDDGDSASIQWTFRRDSLGRYGYCCSPIMNDGILYFLSQTYSLDTPDTTRLCAVACASTGLLDSPWPTFRKDKYRRGKFDYPEVSIRVSGSWLIAEVDGGYPYFDYIWEFGDSTVSRSSTSSTDSIFWSDSGCYVVSVTDSLNCVYSDSIWVWNRPDYLWTTFKSLLDLPNPSDTTGCPISDTIPLYIEVKENEITAKDLQAQNPVSGALVMVLRGEEYAIGNLDSVGIFSDSLITVDDSTFILVTKPGYRKQIVYPHGAISRNDTIRSDIKILGDLEVSATCSLFVFEDVNFFFESKCDSSRSGYDTTLSELIVKGYLEVIGDSTDTVKFVPADTSSAVNQWGGIVVDSGGSANISFAEFSRAKGAINMKPGSDYLELYSAADDASGFNISNSFGISKSKSVGTIQIFDPDSGSIIDDCYFDLSSGAFDVAYAANKLIIRNTVFDNVGQMGIYSEGSHIELDNVQINGTYHKGSYGIYANASDLSLRKCAIDSVEIGIHAQDNSTITVENTSSTTPTSITNCGILVRNANNYGNPELSCEYVWWGDSLGPDIQKLEYPDNIDYAPWIGAERHDCTSPNVHCVPLEYSYIQEAIDYANPSNPDTVYLLAGTFNERGIRINKEIVIDGSGIEASIINGQDIPPRIFTTDSLPSADSIWASSFSVVNGLDTFTTGNQIGGGWSITGINGWVMLDSIKFESCSTVYGGAIWSKQANLDLDHCYFVDNVTPGGGGAIQAQLRSNGLRVHNSWFENNVGQYGGAIKTYNQNGTIIENSVFLNNYASLWGGAIDMRGAGSDKIINNTFFENLADSLGGAESRTNNSSATWRNNIYWNDSSATGKEIYLGDDDTYYMYNCNIDWSDIVDRAYIDDTLGLIDTVPGFLDDTLPDLRLASASAMIDIGDTTDAPIIDFSGMARDSLPDIGAFEYPEGGYKVWRNPRPTETPVGLPVKVDLDSPVPNPFNSTVELGFFVNEAANVRIDLYSSDGRLVRNIVDDRIEKGAWQTFWDGTDTGGKPVSSGVYIFKLSIDGQHGESKNVTFIK